MKEVDQLVFFLVVVIAVFFLIFLLSYNTDDNGSTLLEKLMGKAPKKGWKGRIEKGEDYAKSRMGCDSDNKPTCFNGEVPKCIQIKTEDGTNQKGWQCEYYHLAPTADGSAIYPAFPSTYYNINATDFSGEVQLCNENSNPYNPDYTYNTSCGFGTFNSKGTASVSNYGEYSPGDITGFRLKYENPSKYGFHKVRDVNGSTIFQEATSSTLAPTLEVCEEQCINDKGDGSVNGQNGCYGYVYNPTSKTCNTYTLTSTTRTSGSSKVLKNPYFP